MITFLKVQNLGAIRNKFSILRNKISMNSIKEKNNSDGLVKQSLTQPQQKNLFLEHS